MIMRKISAIIAALLLILAFAACGQDTDEPKETDTKLSSEEKNTEKDTKENADTETAPKGNAVTELMDKGYYISTATCNEEVWKCFMQKQDDNTSIYFGKAAFTPEKYDEYSAIEFDDEESMKAFISGLDVTVTDISDKIPSQSELDAYIGKTLGELENEGFENVGNIIGEDIYKFFYDGPVYSCTVSLKDGAISGDIDDYSVNDLKALEIGSVEYTGISQYLMDNL